MSLASRLPCELFPAHRGPIFDSVGRKITTLYENRICPAACFILRFVATAFTNYAFLPKLATVCLTTCTFHSLSCLNCCINVSLGTAKGTFDAFQGEYFDPRNQILRQQRSFAAAKNPDFDLISHGRSEGPFISHQQACTVIRPVYLR